MTRKFSHAFLPACAAAIALVASANGVQAKDLYNFCSQAHCSDGENPSAIIADSSRDIIGTTRSGGANYGGTVFERFADGEYSVLYDFCSKANCADGAGPSNEKLAMDTNGNIYGTTGSGGGKGAGVVFEYSGQGAYSVLYSFCGQANCTDGSVPAFSGLVIDSEGNLYGNTVLGGANGEGVIYELSPPYGQSHYTVLYSFCQKSGCTDGEEPTGGLLRDEGGNIFGTAAFGGANGLGVVFELAANGAYTVLHSFCSVYVKGVCTDGSAPYGGVIEDSGGNLYGTTIAGGTAPSLCNNGQNTCGTVFEIVPNGANSTETVLYDFCTQNNGSWCTDGAEPYAGLLLSGKTLYGTASGGGANNGGSVFSLPAAGGTFGVLYSFCDVRGCTDGENPLVGVILVSGYLYGTTYKGGKDGGGVLYNQEESGAAHWDRGYQEE
jgi:uncharacterized repeat protein (TIGR03803 family)